MRNTHVEGAFTLLFSREKELAHKALTIHLSPKWRSKVLSAIPSGSPVFSYLIDL